MQKRKYSICLCIWRLRTGRMTLWSWKWDQALPGGKGRLTVPKGTFWGDRNGHFLIGVVVMWLDIFIKSHQTAHVKCVHIRVWHIPWWIKYFPIKREGEGDKNPEHMLPTACSSMFKQHAAGLASQGGQGALMSESSLGHPSPGPTKLVIDRPGVTWDTVLSGSPGKDLSPRCGRRKQKQHQTPSSGLLFTWATYSTSLCLRSLVCEWKQCLGLLGRFKAARSI